MANSFWRLDNPVLWICVAFSGLIVAAAVTSQKKEKQHEEFATSDTRMLTKIRNDYDRKVAMYLPRRVGNPEPWQMTQEEFIEQSLKHIKRPPKLSASPRHALKLAHAELVAKAIKEGKKVPDHVMKDYSDDELYKFYPPWKNQKNPGKHPWEMVRDRYIEDAVAKRPPMTLSAFGGPEYADWESRFWFSGAHAEAVARALKEGKKVPAEVLEYYLEHPLTESTFPWNRNPGKQPWEMTRGEWLIDVAHYWKEQGINQGRKLDLMIGLDMQAALHKLLVKDAIQEGKPVPAAVLKDYPKLIPVPGKRKEEWQMTKTEYADAMISKGEEMMKRAEKYRRQATPGDINLFTKQGQKINEKASYLIQGGMAIKKPSQPPYADNWGNPHKTVIEGALMKGKPVPAEVLKDYPELIGKY